MKYVEKIQERYWRAGKKEKGQILDEFCRVCGYHRKHAIRLLSEAQRKPAGKSSKSKRYKYSSRMISLLEAVWETAGYPWSQRLKKIVALWMPWIQKHYAVTPQVQKEILKISARQMDRRLAEKKKKRKKRFYGKTKPGHLLKHQIPIRTKNWDILQAGFLEMDTVAHCGESLAGEFIYTLNCVDLHTGWVERRAVMGKGEYAVFTAFTELQQAFPFRIRGIDSDNGGEFINHHLYRYCQTSRPKILFTRGRPYEPKDSAHIEEKNWTHVRKIFGWERYDTSEALEAMNDLYQQELRWWHNFFQPSVQQLSKVQKGSKWIRRYGPPQTPWERILSSPETDPRKRVELQTLLASLDPFELSQQIDRKLEVIYSLASRRSPSPKSRISHPWKNSLSSVSSYPLFHKNSQKEKRSKKEKFYYYEPC